MRAVVAEMAHRLPPYVPSCGMEGKMLGALIVKWCGQVGYLMAYSGQIAGEKLSLWGVPQSEWVPMVLDYLQPNGYFKTHEGKISLLNHEIEDLISSSGRSAAQVRLAEVSARAEQDIDSCRQTMRKAKARRDDLRRQGGLNAEAEAALVRESQYLKAELHRAKLRWRDAILEAEEQLSAFDAVITAKKKQRRQMSDALQGWLFSNFKFRCYDGSEASLLDIFSPNVPPSGAGECCEPKLLDYALRHSMRPIEMAMFWWGDAPAAEVRRHGCFYPACNGKCRPILSRMLRGCSVAPEVQSGNDGGRLRLLYEDEWLAVVSKPAGMLSVPGKAEQPSVQELMRKRWLLPPDVPIMPHRLDMATSGLMVVARDADTYKSLQTQFANHTISKVYKALLPASGLQNVAEQGRIELPLRPDIDDRPRQLVDEVYGRKAITEYRVTGRRVRLADGTEAAEVELRPLTGRTHQLRVHCAHAGGLGLPIVGDPLYGCGGSRLYLHACGLGFAHPHSGKQMNFSDPAPW